MYDVRERIRESYSGDRTSHIENGVIYFIKELDA